MQKKMFLKLEGVQGESQNPRHVGEIEIFSMMWGGKKQPISASGAGPGKALINDLTVSRPPDKTSPALWGAYLTTRNFAKVFLTIEEVSESGGLLRSVIFKLKSVLVDAISQEDSFTFPEGQEIIALNFESAELISS